MAIRRRTYASLVTVLLGLVMLTACSDTPKGTLLCDLRSKAAQREVVNGFIDTHEYGDFLRISINATEQLRTCEFRSIDASNLAYDLSTYVPDTLSWREKAELRDNYPRILPDFLEQVVTAPELYAAWSMTATHPNDPWGVIDLQKGLGYGLARATDPTHPAHVSDAYVAELRRLGGELIQSVTFKEAVLKKDSKRVYGPTVYGWSILAPLLRYGDFHADFLVPVAADIVRFDQAHKGDWTVEDQDRVSFDPAVPDANNAMDAVLATLAHNPTALQRVAAEVPDPRLDTLLKGR